MLNKKVIIIGGGISGLISGAILSKEGFCVTIVEKNQIIGGGLQSFNRFGQSFDTGIHVVAGLHPGGNLYKLFKYLGIENKIDRLDVDTKCTDRIYVDRDNATYDIASGKDGFIESLSTYFPHQKNNICKYVDAMYTIASETDLFNLRSPKRAVFELPSEYLLPAADFINKYIDDDKLRRLLAFWNIYYAGASDATPAFVHAVISVLYFSGAQRLVGGSLSTVKQLTKIIEKNGGQILTNECVKEINYNGHSIVNIKTNKNVTLSGDYYISSIALSALFPLFTEKTLFSKALISHVNNLKRSHSAFILNIKIKADSLPFFNHSIHYITDYSDIWNNCCKNGHLRLFCMTPPVVNQNKHARTFVVIMPMNWENVSLWENSTVGCRPKEYYEWKDNITHQIVEALDQKIEHFSESIEEINSASPLTIRDYYGEKEGGMCGIMCDNNDFLSLMFPVRTKCSNFFITGQDCFLPGLCGVSLTSIMTCEAIVGNNTILKKIRNL